MCMSMLCIKAMYAPAHVNELSLVKRFGEKVGKVGKVEKSRKK